MTSRRTFLRSAALLAIRATPLAGQTSPATGARPGDERTIAGIPLCWCPPGRFVMGSPSGESGRRGDEDPVTAILTKGFWAGKFEVTQGEWRRIAGAYPGQAPSARFGLGDDMPMYWVSYLAAAAFCAKANTLGRGSDQLSGTWSFRLPTEAQWEYACRAGTTTATAFGDSLGRDRANFGEGVLNGGADGPRLERSVRVGSYPPNAWGLHDMHGNVWEWCRDYYHRELPGGVDPDLSEVRGQQNRDGTYSRVRRGGAWIEEGVFCRSAARLPYEPHRDSDHIGFRVIVSEI